MTTPRSLVHLLRNVTARELTRALTRDGFSLRHGLDGWTVEYARRLGLI